MSPVTLNGQTLSARDVCRVAHGAQVQLSEAARDRLNDNHRDWLGQGSPDILARKQALLVGFVGHGGSPWQRLKAFVRSHCAGVGPNLPTLEVRALMVTRANQLAAGSSGVRPEAVDHLLDMLNAGVHPIIPSQGSVGAAGDLAPLAHLAQVAFRLGGEAERHGVILPADQAMKGLPAFAPTPKEALSFINGASLTAAQGAIAVHRADRLLRNAELALAMSMGVVLADLDCLDERALSARRHDGAVQVAARVRGLLKGSQLVTRQRNADAFSVRCAPAVLGAAWDALSYVRATVERELNGACDNPLVFGQDLIEAGNFHGAPVAMALDHLKVALTQAASIAERRLYRLTYGKLTGNLPSFLVQSSGVDSGFMLAQYTAASLVSECKGLSFPGSVDSIPTGQHHEDHVSMGPVAARTLLQVVEAVAEVFAIEVMVAAQGLDFRQEGSTWDKQGRQVQGAPVPLAPAIARAHALVRERVPRWRQDRVLHRDIAAAAKAVRGGVFLGDPVAW